MKIYDYSDKKRKSGKTMGIQHRFRLALKDKEALSRTKSYLDYFGIKTNEVEFNDGAGLIPAIQTTSPYRFKQIEKVIEIKEEKEFYRGWLAGFFDAEGSGSGSIRFHNTNDSLLDVTAQALEIFGFSFVKENKKNSNVKSIRLKGGKSQVVKFWNITTPSIKRKFDLVDSCLRGSVGITKITPLNQERKMYDITTGTENFIANGLVSHNCYVPIVIHMKRPDFDAGATLRNNYIQRLEAEARKYQELEINEQVMLSFSTDPYHLGDTAPTRQTLEILMKYGLGFCTLTKGGSRALRDIDLFRKDRDAFASTLTSVDNDFAAKWERRAAAPTDRMKTLKSFHDKGIFTWVSIEPTLDIASALEVIRQTHEYVDLYKIGRANYIPSLGRSIDWKEYTERVIELCQKLGVKHYIKKKLQEFLPVGYHNPMRIPQYHRPNISLSETGLNKLSTLLNSLDSVIEDGKDT
jgi:hypothetical protein